MTNPEPLQSSFKKTKGIIRAQFEGLFSFILCLVLFITFLYKPFKIPTPSMVPTLLIGDFLLVDKFCYGYSRYSFPFRVPAFSGRIWASSPQRGDVVVFNHPKDPEDDYSGILLEKLGIMKKTGKDYIKRLIGMPGDKIQLIEGELYINDKKVKLKEIDDFMYHDYHSNKTFAVKQFIQTLPNGVSHLMIKTLPFGQASKDNFGPVIVPPKHYFFMGDNRDNSKDSRWLDDVGFVHEDLLIGAAKLTFFSTSASLWAPWEWPFGIEGRLNRILRPIDFAAAA